MLKFSMCTFCIKNLFLISLITSTIKLLGCVWWMKFISVLVLAASLFWKEKCLGCIYELPFVSNTKLYSKVIIESELQSFCLDFLDSEVTFVFFPLIKYVVDFFFFWSRSIHEFLVSYEEPSPSFNGLVAVSGQDFWGSWFFTDSSRARSLQYAQANGRGDV